MSSDSPTQETDTYYHREACEKNFESSLRDRAVINNTCEGRLKESDRTGKLKAEIYQNGILPKTLWPLLLYDFPIFITDLERGVSCYMRNEEMAGPSKDLEQLDPLWKHLKTETPIEIHQGGVQSIVCKVGAAVLRVT